MGYTIISSKPPVYDHTGWSEESGLTCHNTLMAWVNNLPVDSLEYVRADCTEAVRHYKESKKANHYLDTALYCGQRLTKLRKAP